MKAYPIPTGYLIVDQYSNGQLETLSIGDYGKHHNVKADFLGYSNRIDGVPNTHCMPLSEKWVVTLSTQYGCPMKCNFCDVPNIKFAGNASHHDLWDQLIRAIRMFPEVKYTERLNIHFARMGEPVLNDAVFSFAEYLYRAKGMELLERTGLRVETLHPVLTTSLPAKFKPLGDRLLDWCRIKNEIYNGQAGLQFSINSTDENQRAKMFGGQAMRILDFAELVKKLPPPIGRKYCLNFAYATGNIVDVLLLAKHFSPDEFMCKITPIHNNNACRTNGVETVGGYDSYEPYRELEERLKRVGYDVLVFVPSIDEEDGLVTCGNAVLGGSKLKTPDDSVIKIRGIVR